VPGELSQRMVRTLPLILMAVLLSVLWASPGRAHSGHTHQIVSAPAAGTATNPGFHASRQVASDSVRVSSHSGRLDCRASASSLGAMRHVAWARSADVPRCGPACGEGCAGCNCGSCQGTCSSGNACSAACASVHGAIVSQKTNAYGISEVVQFLLPIAERTNGRTLSPEPPPPKS